MHPTLLQRLKRFLRAPALIMAEIAVITLAGVVGTLLPAGTASEHIFRSGWFLGTVTLAFASLLIVVSDQIRRLYRDWSSQSARTGSLIIHVGLLLVILAGAVKLLFGAEAVVDMMEGETLPPTSSAWAVQKPGILVNPLRIDTPVTLNTVQARRYQGGDLQNLAVKLSLAETAETAPLTTEIPVNKSIEASGVRLFVGSDYGPAALIEWHGGTGATTRTAALLKHERGHRFEGILAGPDGERAYLRSTVKPDGTRPDGIDVRVMKESALLFAGAVHIGESIPLPSGSSLALRGTPFWVRLHANRDPTIWLIYLGFAFLILGITVRFTLHPTPHAVLLLACLLGVTACNGTSKSDARQLVERYNTVVSEAYRRGDVKLVDAVVGPNEGRKLTGLIGVRLDMGITLDSKMLEMVVLDTDQTGNELRVRTRERWSYCDRRIGTGEQVGKTSVDSYEMLYFFQKSDREWLVDRIEFAKPPQFGRPPSTWAVEHGWLPGHTPLTPKQKESSSP